MEDLFKTLVLVMPFLQAIRSVPSHPYYYYEPSQRDPSYYNDNDNVQSLSHTMGIPHTKDNSMRALVDIITPKQTPRGLPTATTRKSSEDLFIDYYGSQVKHDQASNVSGTQSYYNWDDYYNDYYGEGYDYEEVFPQRLTVSSKEFESDVATHLTTDGANLTDLSSGHKMLPDLSTPSARMRNPSDISLGSYVAQTISKVTLPENTSTEIMTNSMYNSTENPFRPTDSLELDYGDFAECDMETQRGCDIIHFERCDQQTKKCRCLHGYVRSWKDRGQCQAASFYHGHVTMRDGNFDRNHHKQKISSLRQELLHTIYQLLKKRSNLNLLDITINSLETKGEELTLSFDLSMAKASILETENVDTLWKDLVLFSSSGDLQPLVAVNITANAQEKGFNLFSPLVEINQCARQGYHHCSQMAHCLYDSPKVTCRCQPGFEDAAAELHRLPGEVCVEKCSCKNGGLCLEVHETEGTKQCSCLPWYIGRECEIDGKELLVICVCCLGLFIIISVGLCCGFHARAKHKENAAKSRLFHFTPEPNIIKLPRVWMDTPGFHDDLSPQNARRLSLASGADVNEYFGGFILEDLSGSSIQRHADALSSYYQTTANLCGVPSSSQQSLFRY